MFIEHRREATATQNKLMFTKEFFYLSYMSLYE